jgi:divalent metal cation (Fe/Co/Zn/Cd) transporter
MTTMTGVLLIVVLLVSLFLFVVGLTIAGFGMDDFQLNPKLRFKLRGLFCLFVGCAMMGVVLWATVHVSRQIVLEAFYP